MIEFILFQLLSLLIVNLVVGFGLAAGVLLALKADTGKSLVKTLITKVKAVLAK